MTNEQLPAETMSTTTLSVPLPEALKEHVYKRVAEAGYSNASDFVGALIRFDKQQQEKLAALRRSIAVGIEQLDRGEGLEGEHVFAELLHEQR